MKELVLKMTMNKTAARITPNAAEIEEALLRAREVVTRHANNLPRMEQIEREAYERVMIPSVFNSMSPKIFPDLQLKPYEAAKTISGTISDYSSALKNLTDATKNVIDIKSPDEPDVPEEPEEPEVPEPIPEKPV